MKLLTFGLSSILLSFSFVYGENLLTKDKGNKWPACIAQFCFDQQAPKESVLIQIYGNGTSNSNDKKYFHCYAAINQKLFIKFTIYDDITPFIDSILVSNKPVCAEAKQPIKLFEQLKTLEGLMIGDEYEKAIQLYGLPKYIRTEKELNKLIHDEFFASNQEMGFDKAVAYGSDSADDLLVTWLFLHDNKIVAILMTISE